MSEFKMTVPQEMLQQMVESATIAALKDSGGMEAMITELVKGAIRERADYGRGTKFQGMVRNALQKVINTTVERWVEDQRAALEQAVRAQLDERAAQLMPVLARDLVLGLVCINPKIGFELKPSADRREALDEAKKALAEEIF